MTKRLSITMAAIQFKTRSLSSICNWSTQFLAHFSLSRRGSMLKVEAVQNMMAYCDAWEGKWRGNRRLERVATTLALYLGTWSIHGLPADPHSSTASSRLNWLPRRFKWTRPFLWKTKSGFCACAITFQTCSTNMLPVCPLPFNSWTTWTTCTKLFLKIKAHHAL